MSNTLKFGNGQWATKEGSTLAYNDENNNFKPLPFNFERGSSATVVNKDGLIETVGSDMPRIDYKDDSEGALLLEPQRTNRMPNSEDGSTWALNNTTLSSLNGGLNKKYYQITSLGNTGRFDVVQNNWVNTTAGTYTASVFAKKGTCDEIILTTRANFGFQNYYSAFDLTNGLVTANASGVVGSIKPYGDGWYRCSITFTNTGGFTDSASFAFGFNFNSSSTDTLFVASPQSEIGSYATSYIPTQGSTVTRLADICNGAGNEQVFNDSEGVLYLEVAALSDDLTNRGISISGGTAANKIQLKFDNSSNQIEYDVSRGSVSQVGIDRVITDTTLYNKIACKWKVNDFSLWVNGVEIGVDTSGDTPLGLSNLSFYDANGGNSFYGNIKDVKVYNTALTDSELAALTQA